MTEARHTRRGTRIIIFAKAPQPGMAKTRLIPALGAQGAAVLAGRMLTHTMDQALAAELGPVTLCMTPGPDDPMWANVLIPGEITCSAQGEGDLGQRMAGAVARAFCAPEGAKDLILIGTDCPALSAAQLKNAARKLAQHDAVVLPASDGGYVLLGLKAPCPVIFDGMPWSTPAVATLTLERLIAQGLRVWQGDTLHDIDEPADLVHLAHLAHPL